MNRTEFISSGILEAYVLGEVTPAERLEVEKAILDFPEVREELLRIELTVEKLSFGEVVNPDPALKQKLMGMLGGRKPGKQRRLDFQPSYWKYAVAAAIAISFFTSYLAFYYHRLWQENSIEIAEIREANLRIASDYNVVNNKLDKILGDLAIIQDPQFQKVSMKGTANDTQAFASVYWNPESREVYLNIQQLKAISKENQFQLWAIVKGMPVDAGVFDLDLGGLLKMKEISGASAFAITIEKKGGSVNPTMETMQVIGAVISPS